MKNALLLFLSASHLHAQIMRGGKIVAQHEFDDTAAGPSDFAAFMKTVHYRTYLLVDLIEEDFRQESIPHLIGGSRNALLQRKFEQFYRGTPFRQATLLKRQKTGRRDDDMLFSALTNPALVTPWLNILLAHKIPLVGIYSVPQISAPLVKDHPSNYLLLISWEKSAGLRQTYFSDHRLQISRLTPINADLTFQDAVTRELPRTYQYLKSLSLLPAGQMLDVRLLGQSRDLIELQSTLPANADMRYDFVDLENLADKLDIEHRFTDSDASQVFMHYLATTPPPTHYANTEHVHYCTLWRLRRALNWIAGGLLVGSLGWGTADIWQSGWNANEARTMDSEARLIQNEVKQITDAFPNTFAPASDMKASVSIMHQLGKQTLAPGEAMQPLGSVLERYPRIELDELGWKMDAAEPTADNMPSAIPAQVVTLNGRLLGFENDYRTALDHLDRFQHDLEKQGYRVTALSKPLDVSPSGNISDRIEAQQQALTFALKLSRRSPE
ncbi:MAG: hypothetical protein M0P59_10745 [Gallionella sp.]|jgi:hypothetical protein|nr:hypothetical protein [Gallionella sp.]MCK9354625.1 hypothetical protein [Gallionella sp.]